LPTPDMPKSVIDLFFCFLNSSADIILKDHLL
jgi:hypothetical protein